MFRRALLPYEAERVERERIAARKPHLALVDHVPTPAKAAEPDFYTWHDVSVLLPVNGEG